MAEEVQPGAGLSYALGFPVQDANKDLVDVFVNGHRVRIESVAGPMVQLFDPGYSIDPTDEVFFLYQKA